MWVRLPPAVPGMRIGLLGGSFNPPHAGHLHVSLEALVRLRLDRVWWLVSPGNPLKSHDELEGLGARMARARAMASHPRIVVTDLETQLGTAYTSETLEFLRRRLPQVRFVWLMGADNLADIHRWQHWRRILEGMPVAVLDRPGWRYRALAAPAARACAAWRWPERAAPLLAEARPPAWMLLDIPLDDSSSTAIRAARRVSTTL